MRRLDSAAAAAEEPPRSLSGLAKASGVLYWFPWALMCILRFASRLNPFPHISQKWMCSASNSTASSSTISESESRNEFSTLKSSESDASTFNGTDESAASFGGVVELGGAISAAAAEAAVRSEV